MYLAHAKANDQYELEQIPAKVVSDKRLLNYGVEEDSIIFIQSFHGIPLQNQKNELIALATKVLRASSKVTIREEITDFEIKDRTLGGN